MSKFKAAAAVASAAILIAIIWLSDPAKLLQTVAAMDKRYIAAGAALSLISMSFRVLKWKLLVGTDYLKLFPVQLLGMTMSNFTPGKLGEPAKAIVLRSVTGMPVARSLPTIIWERMLDILVLLLLSFAFLQSVPLAGDIVSFSYIGMAAFLAAFVVAGAIVASRSIGKKIFMLLRKLPLLNKINDSFVDSFYSARSRKRDIAASFAATLVPWLLDGGILYLMLLSLGTEASALPSVLLVSGIIAISTIVGVASSLPGGLGTSETVSILLLTNIGILNVEAVAAVFLYRALTFWLGSFAGGLSFFYLSGKADLSLRELMKSK